jgi:hypothetical protein
MGGQQSKEYMKNYYATHSEEIKARSREWYANNKERSSFRCREYVAENKEAVRASRRAYYETHKAEIGEKSKEYRKNNKERLAVKSKELHAKNRDRDLERSRRHYNDHREEYLEKSRQYQKNNKERIAEQSRAWVAANPQKRLEVVRKYNHKLRSTPKGNLSSTVSKRMNESLRKGMKAGRHWESLVDFTVDQLKAHIEKLFEPGMSWENYGTVWHIDHKIPVAAFNFEKPEDIDFKICWSLKNLQPLEAIKNMSKRDKIDKPFQPALAIAV